MATLLWLAVGVLLALVTWLIPDIAILIPLIILAVAIVAILLPRDVTAAGAKVAIGFGAFYVIGYGRFMVPDPLEASGEAYLLSGTGIVILLAGLAGAWRAWRRRRRQARIRAATDLLAE
ncbi:MAG TPA: hypothetical protein VIC63_07535 [Candidatus Limnocylindria bacterium]|jgi:hypothetical protein